jgi:hypothetical protein
MNACKEREEEARGRPPNRLAFSSTRAKLEEPRV